MFSRALGDDDDAYQVELAPKKVEALDKEVIVNVICGHDSTIAFAASEMVYFFGRDEDFKRVLTPSINNGINGKVISISINTINGGDFVGGFVTRSGELYTWGDDDGYGCLGHNASDYPPSTPKLVEALSGVVCKQVCCGGRYTAVVTENGRVYEFGQDMYYGFAGGNYVIELPTLVHALETIDIKEVQCDSGIDGDLAVALSTSGYVYTWGFCGRSPRLVEELREDNVVQISCSSMHYAVLVDPSPCPIREAQKAQFNNKDHSDVTFMVDNQPIYGSIDTLSSKCKYFEGMFRSKMKESIEGVVVVSDVSAVAFLKLLEYLCLDDFLLDDMDASSKEDLCKLADMYMLDGLRLLLNREAVDN